MGECSSIARARRRFSISSITSCGSRNIGTRFYGGRIAERARDQLREICQAREAVIIRGAVAPDQMRMLVSAPPDMAPAKLVPYLKGRSSRRLQDEFWELRKRYWGSTCERGAIFARVWARWTRKRSRNTLRIKDGKNRIKGSRSQRPPSLEPALTREPFRRLQPPPRPSVGT
jgi:putative transposase